MTFAFSSVFIFLLSMNLYTAHRFFLPSLFPIRSIFYWIWILNPLMSQRLFSRALNEEFLVPLFTIQICSVFAAKKACISAFRNKQKTDLIYLVQNTFYKNITPKNPKNFVKLKLRIFFQQIRKNYFGHNLKTNKDISKIPADSDSAEQQLKDSKL